MAVFERRLKVGKTDAFALDVSNWSEGEAITALNVTSDSLTTVGSTQIDGSLLKVFLTGDSEGNSAVEFQYSTATRDDCYEATVIVVDEC